MDVGHQEAIAGLALRYRRWLSPKTALDLGLGTPLVGYATLDWATLKAKLGYRDLVGPVVRLEIGQGTSYWNAGLEAGAHVGLVGLAVAGVLGIIAVAAAAASL